MSGGSEGGGTRTFIAIELAEQLQTALALQLRSLRHRLPSLPWVDPVNLHLTLAFLGSLSAEQVDAAGEATRMAARTASPFSFGLSALGTFGPPDSPRVVWAGLAGELAPLYRLQAKLVDQLDQRRVPLVDGLRVFSPHLTLARLKRPLLETERRQLWALVRQPLEPAVASATMRVERIVVMKSELLRPVARYTPLEFCRLGPG
jgi:RNA 2',3'-cyclic 3'-phosphodiesterase